MDGQDRKLGTLRRKVFACPGESACQPGHSGAIRWLSPSKIAVEERQDTILDVQSQTSLRTESYKQGAGYIPFKQHDRYPFPFALQGSLTKICDYE